MGEFNIKYGAYFKANIVIQEFIYLLFYMVAFTVPTQPPFIIISLVTMSFIKLSFITLAFITPPFLNISGSNDRGVPHPPRIL